MPLSILIIPDKFKGTLTAEAAAGAIARGWRRIRRSDRVERLPMSDGGDGFGRILTRLLGARQRRTRTVDAANRPCVGRWAFETRTKTAVIETASVVGLAMLPPGRFHPFDLDTRGLGRVLQAAARTGAARCVAGIGGSATNDGGFGLALSLGWEFFDAAGRTIARWTELARLKRIRRPQTGRWFREVQVAVDVQNRLLGKNGATRVYGPQKGLGPDDFTRAEGCLQRLATVFEGQFGGDLAEVPGAGAAGGLGFGLMAFAGGKLVPGFDLFARYAGLDARLRQADLVITGEGAIDRSTLMGKGVGEIARRCRDLGIPCIGLAGMVTPEARQSQLFEQMQALTDLTGEVNAKRQAAIWLKRLAASAARGWPRQRQTPTPP